MTTQKPRVQISRDDFLKTFANLYNDTEHSHLDTIPDLMEKQMRHQQPLMHMLSKYVIRPSAFDRDQFQLPKASIINKHYYGNNNYQNIQRQQHQAPIERRQNDAAIVDDFETVEVSKKKAPQPRFQRQIYDEPEPVQTIEQPKSVIVEKPKQVEQIQVAVSSQKPLEALKQPQPEKVTQPANPVKQTKPAEPKKNPEQLQKAAEVVPPKVQPIAVTKVVEEVKKQESPQRQAAPVEELKKVENFKGPKPKGLKKFKAVKQDEPEIPVEELSENQKKKIENARKKAEEEERLAKEAEKLRKKQEEDAKIAERQKYEAEQRRKTEEMFKALAQAQPPQKVVSKFEDVMKEDEKLTKQQKDIQTRIQNQRQREDGGMRFDYNDPYKKQQPKEAENTTKFSVFQDGKKPPAKK